MDDVTTTEDQQMDIGPGEEAVILPSGEVKIYVTSVYVQAPASSFDHSNVMPVNEMVIITMI